MKKIDSRAGERGAVSIKTLLTFLIVGLGIFAAVKIVPVYAEQRQIVFEVDELANKASVRNLKEEEVKKAIDALLAKYTLPEGSIKIDSYAANKVQLTLGYSKAIDFLITKYDWKVNYVVSGKAI